MIKTITAITILFLHFNYVYTQLNFRSLTSTNYFTTESEQFITDNRDDPRSIFGIDIDNDGDIDIVVGYSCMV